MISHILDAHFAYFCYIVFKTDISTCFIKGVSFDFNVNNMYGWQTSLKVAAFMFTVT